MSDIEKGQLKVQIPKGVLGFKMKTTKEGLMIGKIDPEKCKIADQLCEGDIIVGAFVPPDDVRRGLTRDELRDFMKESKKTKGRQLFICRMDSESEVSDDPSEELEMPPGGTLSRSATAGSKKNQEAVPIVQAEGVQTATANIMNQVQHPSLAVFTSTDKSKGCCGMSPKILCVHAVLWSLLGIILFIVALFVGPLATSAAVASCSSSGAVMDDIYYYNTDDCVASSATAVGTTVIVSPILFIAGIILLIVSCVCCCCVCANAGNDGETRNSTTIMSSSSMMASTMSNPPVAYATSNPDPK